MACIEHNDTKSRKIVKIQSVVRKYKTDPIDVLKTRERKRSHNLRGVLTDFSLNLGVGTVTVNTTGEKLFMHQSHFVQGDVFDVFQNRTVLEFDASNNPRNPEQRQANCIRCMKYKPIEMKEYKSYTGVIDTLKDAKTSGTITFDFNSIRFRVFFHSNNIRNIHKTEIQEKLCEGATVVFDVQSKMNGMKHYACNIRLV